MFVRQSSGRPSNESKPKTCSFLWARNSSAVELGYTSELTIHATRVDHVVPQVGDLAEYRADVGCSDLGDHDGDLLVITRVRDVLVLDSRARHELLPGAVLVLFPARVVEVLIECDHAARR
jgi:hypothetical protein